ncbi:MAG: hypothetical protein JNK21_06350 [Rhodospirillaceae bacterium]|nr:hypothetical protein [Rhodospirillaceae bacterium]
MNILPIAASSMTAASTAVAIRANNIVNVDTPGFQASAPVFQSQFNAGVAVFAQSTDQPVNLTLNVLGLKSALQQYEASAALVQAGIEQNKALLSAVA